MSRLKFKLSEELTVNSDEEPWRTEGLRICLFGGPGSGKSYTAALLAEQFLAQGGTVVAFHPRAELYVLKERFDVLVVGGPYMKELDFAPVSPSSYAKAVVESGLSMVFYTEDVEDEEKLVDFTSRFIRYLLKYE
ncbi:MAG: ATP-binding protein, partial [Thermofilum sp.]